ncbi:MAG: ATP-binding protein, partial [Pseudomonadota bacterium]
VFSVSGRLQFYNRAFRETWHLPRTIIGDHPHVDTLFDTARTNVREGDVGDIMRSLIAASTDGRTERSGRLELTDGRFLRFAAVPLPDGNALFTFVDVTDSERVEIALRDRNEALEAADEAKSRFVENMSYELRTPLTAIAGFAELLSMNIAGPINEKQADYVGSIATSADRLRVMINGIIDLAVSDVEGLALARDEVDVSHLLTSVAVMVESSAADRGMAFELDAGDSCGTVSGDPVRLKQALYNLVANAVRFTPEGGHVRLAATGDDDQVCVTIADNGIGIPKDEQDLVFERFRKGSTAGAGQGVGLGLSLVREIVDLHGGTLEVVSAVDEGTEMRVYLPRRAAVAVAGEAARLESL